MIFWICLLVGLVIGFIASRKSFGIVWATFFNLLLSIYLAVIVTAVLAKAFPESFKAQWAKMLMFLGLSFVSFIVLEFIAHSFFLHCFKVKFPEKFEIAANSVLGFFTGYILVGFVLFVMAISPLQSVPGIRNILEDKAFVRSVEKPILFSCSLVETASFQSNGDNLKKIVAWLDNCPIDELPVETEDNG